MTEQKAHPENSISFTAKLENLATIRNWVEHIAYSLQANQRAVEDMIQAVDEAAANIILHGYAGRTGTIDIKIWREQDALWVQLQDQAPPFDPLQVSPPDLTLNLQERQPGGLGIYFIRQFMDQVSYRAILPEGNELTLVKKAF